MNSSHSEQRRKNILGMCLIILSVLIGISLATYSPRDELLMIHHQLIDNQMGIAGVFVSYFLIKMGLGWFAWGLVPLIFTWGLWIILKKETRVMVRSTFYILGTLLVLSIFFSIDMIAENGMKMQSGFIPGGFTGGTLALFLSDWFGVIPAMIILVFCLILLVTGYFRIHTVQLLKRHSQKKKKEHKQQMAVSPPPAETKIGATPVLSTEKEQIQKVAGGELTKKKKTTGE